MSPDGSPYPTVPGDEDSAIFSDGTLLLRESNVARLTVYPDDMVQKTESPEDKLKKESESPTHIKYINHNYQDIEPSDSALNPGIAKAEDSEADAASSSHLPVHTQPSAPYNTQFRPSSFPLGSNPSYPGPHNNNPAYSQPPRPQSYVGTSHDPFRMLYGPPGLRTQAATLYPPPTTYAPGFSQVQTPGPTPVLYPVPTSAPYLQHAQHAILHQSIEDAESDQEDDQDDELTQPATRRKSGQRYRTVTDFPGYPSHNQIPSQNLSCYEVCQQYPASLLADNMLPFIQRRWSAEEIFDCLPRDVQQILHDRPIDQKTMYLYKRIQKGQKKLKPLIRGSDNEKNLAPFLDLLNGARLRGDGRPSDVKRGQSVLPPVESWRSRHGVGVDPTTGLYVAIASQPNHRYQDLMRAVPAPMLTGQANVANHTTATGSTPQAPSQQRLGPNPLRQDNRRRKGRAPSVRLARSASTITPTPAATDADADRVGTGGLIGGPFTPEVGDLADVNLPQHRAQAAVATGAPQPDLHQAACTPPPSPLIDNFSNTREPTLASMFPDGMINMRGAYVRTISPQGKSIWHGAPSPDFIDNYIRRRGNHEFWMHVIMPQDYQPDAQYASFLPQDAQPEWHPGMAQPGTGLDFDDPVFNLELPREREARLKRKSGEMTPGEAAEEVDRAVKKARLEEEAIETVKEDSPDSATKAIMEVMGNGDEGIIEGSVDQQDGVDLPENGSNEHEVADKELETTVVATEEPVDEVNTFKSDAPAVETGLDSGADADDEAGSTETSSLGHN